MKPRKHVGRGKTLGLLSLLLVLAAGRSAVVLADANQADASKSVAKVPAPKNLAELQAIESKVKQAVARVRPCTVGVTVGHAGGSGVIVSPEGHVMTAGHVVGKPGQEVRFYLPNGKTAKGTTLGVYRSADAGLMKITDEGKWPFVEKGRSADLKPGGWCLAIGHPFGYRADRPPVVRVGRVLVSRETTIQTDCALVGGDSGGPLFDLDGKLIGINSRIGGPMQMNLHVPVDVYHEVWDRLVKGEAWQDTGPGRDSGEVKAAFREVVGEAGKCVLRIKCDGTDAALGTIVGPDGWILTKASELHGKIVCRLRDGRELPARTVGLNKQFDLAMLKIDAGGLPLIQWNDKKPSVGQWMVAPGLTDDPLALGVLSVPQRSIPPISGILGVAVIDGTGGAKIAKVFPKSPAEKVGLKVEDVITHVNGKPTANRVELIAAVRRHRAGETIKLGVKRGDATLKISAKLSNLVTPERQKQHIQNRMGGQLSKRRDDFPAVLQHDIVLRPADCGGPLVDLSGKVVGVNIARGGRTETYCVPTDVLLGLMYDLMSGRLPPPKSEEEKKAEAAKKAEEERLKAEAAKKAEEERQKAEAAKKAEEERLKAEAAKKAEEERLKAEAAKKAEEERQKAEAAKKVEEEQKRKAEENKNAEKENEPGENEPGENKAE